jgi:endogenous inhibitor of DNA gyrase (YacG/DUF329 family)
MKMTVKTVSVLCPHCKNNVLMTNEFPYRPFCSKRCKDIDFGGWASEDYQIEGKAEGDDGLWSEDNY